MMNRLLKELCINLLTNYFMNDLFQQEGLQKCKTCQYVE